MENCFLESLGSKADNRAKGLKDLHGLAGDTTIDHLHILRQDVGGGSGSKRRVTKYTLQHN